MSKKNNKKQSKKNGRPTKYSKKIHLILATALGELGLIDTKIAERMEISEATLNNWKKKYPDFKKALNNGKMIIDKEVENSLLSLTREKKFDEIERTIKTDDKGKELKGETRIKTIKRIILPSVQACIFWLKNRRPDHWRDAQHITHGVDEIKKAGEELADLFNKAK